MKIKRKIFKEIQEQLYQKEITFIVGPRIWTNAEKKFFNIASR